MTQITLVRHAAVDPAWNGRCYGSRCDPALSTVGVAEAISTARDVRPGAITLSSPARRARETAECLGTRFLVDPRWAERDFGEWEGRRWDDCWPEAPAAATASASAYAQYTPPSAETFEQVETRVAEALADLATTTSATVVTHAGPIRAALLLTGMSLADVFAVPIPPCACIPLIRVGDELVLKPGEGAPT